MINLYKLHFDNLKVKKYTLLKSEATIEDLLEFASRHTIETPEEDFKSYDDDLYFNLVDDIEEQVFKRFREKNLKTFKFKDFAFILATEEEIEKKVKSSGWTFIDIWQEIKNEKKEYKNETENN